MLWRGAKETTDELLLDAEIRMEAAHDVLQSSFVGLRAGKASPSMLDGIQVDYHGEQVPLEKLAAIAAPESRLLVVRSYDPTAVGEIERAIHKSKLGLTPQRDGSLIRLPIPPLSQERREQLVKQAKALTEQQRVAIRNVRRDALKKAGAIDCTEDQAETFESDLDALTQNYTGKLDVLLEGKSEDLLGYANRWTPTASKRRKE